MHLNHNRSECRPPHNAVPRYQQHRHTQQQKQSGWTHWETIAGEVGTVTRLKGQVSPHPAPPRKTLPQGGAWINDTQQLLTHTALRVMPRIHTFRGSMTLCRSAKGTGAAHLPAKEVDLVACHATGMTRQRILPPIQNTMITLVTTVATHATASSRMYASRFRSHPVCNQASPR